MDRVVASGLPMGCATHAWTLIDRRSMDRNVAVDINRDRATAPVDVDRIAAVDAELSKDLAVSSDLLMDYTVDAESPIGLAIAAATESSVDRVLT
ncbi:Os11g0605200 [Oryza sativa Japonica Group]|uniref:Uncharacterized protein n=2 Tax=Oryza sativa subsp. japonica TaxID=39947 RepID=A0A8J8Y5R8_ORYSJ|nr:hypothetical protein OsJ_17357 [Oryza sativa Japonica Group]BAT14791.1 Os11g0605200 [Oryza sativa Japonica Group]